MSKGVSEFPVTIDLVKYLGADMIASRNNSQEFLEDCLAGALQHCLAGTWFVKNLRKLVIDRKVDDVIDACIDIHGSWHLGYGACRYALHNMVERGIIAIDEHDVIRLDVPNSDMDYLNCLSIMYAL